MKPEATMRNDHPQEQGVGASLRERATRPPAQAPAGLGDTASVPCAETAFDPGPLTILGRQEKTEIGGFYVIGPDRMGGSTAYVSGQANAALYASAPELYELLATHPAYAADTTFAEIWNWLARKDAALAKARGQ